MRRQVAPHSLRATPAPAVEVNNQNIDNVVTVLRGYVLQITEQAFREYAKAHGADSEKEQIEWLRFQKILSRKL